MKAAAFRWLALGAALGTAGCASSRTPTEMIESMPASSRFVTEASASAVRDCLMPKLDDLRPFALEPMSRRPALVRTVGATTQIFAQDDTFTLYVVEIAPRERGSAVAVFSKNLAEQIAPIVSACGARRV